jgi:S1-C subfamily serine protease
VSLRPVFVGTLEPIASALWADALWMLPPGSDVAPGAFLFTSTGSLVGLVVRHGEARAIVPGATLTAEADRLLARPSNPLGGVGVDVQDLTAPIAAATGATSGVVVTWVDRAGAGAGQVLVGDVIESLDGRSITRDLWDVRTARLAAGETLALRVRSRGRVRDVALTAAAAAEPAANRPLGLTLRARPGIGADVVRLDASSAADRAGLAAGDVITAIGAVQAPTPAQVARSFSATPVGQHLVVGVSRANTHFVTTLHR